MKLDYTKGPWKFHINQIIGPDKQIVVSGIKTFAPKAFANARIIESAPEMYEFILENA